MARSNEEQAPEDHVSLKFRMRGLPRLPISNLQQTKRATPGNGLQRAHCLLWYRANITYLQK